MTTRTIVTSQPDVECAVCERRLLRGEQHDVFIAAGRRRIVCELCAPRAAHEGWMRETDTGTVSLPPLRPRRGRSFLERLRQVGGRGSLDPGEGVAGPAGYDLLLDPDGDRGDAAPETARARSVRRRSREDSAGLSLTGERGGQHEEGVAEQEPAEQEPAEVAPPSFPALALELFNASEFPRRVAGVARSLGAPEVSVHSAEHLSSVVRIIVAWELCWYRYEVDLSDGPGEVGVLDQGTELAELARGDRLSNAVADQAGALTLAA
jgi:hypothetical protein